MFFARMSVDLDIKKGYNEGVERQLKALAYVRQTDDGRMDRGGYKMLVNDIKIFPYFWDTQPSDRTMEKKRRYFKKHRNFQTDIVVDEEGYLLDGFTSYLLAKELRIVEVPVRRVEWQMIWAYHKPGKKLYTWRIPEALTGQISVGDRVVVRTQSNVCCVTVAAVERFIPPNGLRRMKMVLGRADGKSGDGGASARMKKN